MTKRKPLILINFKKVTGKKATELIEKLNKADETLKANYKIAVIIQPEDIHEVSKRTSFSLFIHDIFLKGKLYEVLNKNLLAGGKICGVLLNHPENQLTEDELHKNFFCAKAHNLKVVLGSTSIAEGKMLNKKYEADYIAIENVDLIGKNVSIIEIYPEMTKNAVTSISNNILLGAGVRNAEDIEHVLKSGGSGVLLSSVIVGAKDPLQALINLLKPK